MFQLANSSKRSEKVRLFIEEIYKFYENPKNLAEFEEWRKERIHNDENDMAVKSGGVSDDNRNSRLCRN